ncbi:hypothetical protein LDL48_08035 [Wangella sp. NEAU-J3]|nr:hypothetical protein [Jidongwangia harbinensis]
MENDVWIDAAAAVTPGVTIGHGSVVARAPSSRRTCRR